jgi:hypothetical protein
MPEATTRTSSSRSGHSVPAEIEAIVYKAAAIMR